MLRSITPKRVSPRRPDGGRLLHRGLHCEGAAANQSRNWALRPVGPQIEPQRADSRITKAYPSPSGD